MWLPKLLVSPVKIRIFCQKTTKFSSKLAFLVILSQALPASFDALLVVVAHRLYLARHLPTLFGKHVQYQIWQIHGIC